jgi:hypothetical protein
MTLKLVSIAKLSFPHPVGYFLSLEVIDLSLEVVNDYVAKARPSKKG